MKQYMDSFLDNVKRGLGKATNRTAIVKCFPTYVQDLPNGTEEGKFLALDLGGSNFRVLLVELGGGECKMDSKIYVIPQSIMTGPGVELFDFIAECLADFANQKGVMNEVLPLGFTFSFPLVQVGLTKGILERWTKGFNCEGVIGQDVVQMLEDALARRNDVKIYICAVLNDTTGTLMSCAWKNRDCKIGLILGTGTNGCYLEKQSNAELFDEPDQGSGKVIINLESGAFGDDGALNFCRVEYDEIIDKRSINPGKQKHEKMISGMYLGDIVRLAALRFTKQGVMFGGKSSKLLETDDKFETRYVSEIESDPPGSYTNVKNVCEQLGLGHATEQDYKDLRYICECVSKRAAYLCSAMLATLMNKMGEKKVVVGIDGTLYKNHPHIHHWMVEKITQLVDPSIKFELMTSEDGSGRGAALVAAVAYRVKKERDGDASPAEAPAVEAAAEEEAPAEDAPVKEEPPAEES
nr:unnamed protein product [Callosobruchus chinensis]